MKAHYCFLERFNNYFNRKIIKYDSLSEYEDNSKDIFIPSDSKGGMLPFDFNPNDNVMTEIIANEVPFTPDYFLLLDDESEIIERWFVLEQKRNRQGQWLYSLRRDVVADNLETLKDAPIFVQKGMLPSEDPMIFNQEGMSFNQVKTSEHLLKDASGCSWIICYLAKSLSASDIAIETAEPQPITDYVTLSQIASELGITESVLIDLINIDGEQNKILKLTNDLTVTYIASEINDAYTGNFGISSDFTSTYSGSWVRYWGGDAPSKYLFIPRVMSGFEQSIKNNGATLLSEIGSFMGRNYYLQSSIASIILNKYRNKYVLYQGKYYQLSILDQGTETSPKTFTVNSSPTWNNICENAITTGESYNPNGEITLRLRENNFKLFLSPAGAINKKSTVTISSARKKCLNQEFDIVAIPASFVYIDFPDEYYISQPVGIAQKIASALAIKEGTNIYDIQLLPYCPIPEIISGPNSISIANLTEHVDFDYIMGKDDEDRDIQDGVIFYVENASFTNNIELELEIKDSMKIDSQCDFYRLVSPNYQGSFEFNVAKNGGKVDFFTIYCTYKPFTPFIKVTPNLKYLYGSDFNDNRGLICGGDFSLPRASSAWQQYQLENKNYQNIFNREIQNLDFMQSIEMRNQLVSGATAMFSDTAKGAAAGAYVGGGYGAIIGGTIGLSTSLIGYGIDTDTLAKTQREQKQLAIDKFNYQLGNIKALPYTLTKVGAFDISSKIFPVLEYYTCTDIEKQALKDKIRWESMTVMRIGTLTEFMNFEGEAHYFKGELIRNNTIADDPHTLNAIYEELLKGVYI